MCRADAWMLVKMNHTTVADEMKVTYVWMWCVTGECEHGTRSCRSASYTRAPDKIYIHVCAGDKWDRENIIRHFPKNDEHNDTLRKYCEWRFTEIIDVNRVSVATKTVAGCGWLAIMLRRKFQIKKSLAFDESERQRILGATKIEWKSISRTLRAAKEGHFPFYAWNCNVHESPMHLMV